MPRIAKDKPRVLAVDDESAFLSVLRTFLAPRYDVICLSRAESLPEMLEDFQPDLVILDVRMPGTSGFALCRQIRADPRFSHLPVLFLTACQDDVDFAKNLAAGGTAYLTKPVAWRELLAKVKEVLEESAERV